MSGFFKLTYDVKKLEGEFKAMTTSLQRANVNTLNVVGRMANKAIARHIKSNYNIKQRSLKIGKLVTLKKADVRKGISTFTIFIRRQGRGLFKYGARQTKSGVTVLVRKTRKPVKGGFISVWRKGQSNRFVFRKGRGKNAGTITRRTKTGKTYTAPKREALHGPMVADLYKSRRARRVLDEVIEKNYQKVLNEKFNDQFEKNR